MATIARHPLGRIHGAKRVARWAGLTELWRVYCHVAQQADRFEERFLAALGITWHIRAGSSGEIPRSGGVLIVGNHPTGGAEGLIAQALIGSIRDDWRVLGNSALARLPEIRTRQIGIDGRASDGLALIFAARHLKNGGALIMFPAGTVAHWQFPRGYAEAPWHPSAATLARLSGASVQHLKFSASSSLRWKLLSAVSRSARTALLPQELLAQRGKIIGVDIASPMSDPVDIQAFFNAKM